MINKRYVNLIFFKAYADLKAEVHRYFAGVAWWVFEPVLQMVVYYIVFGTFLKQGTSDFVTFLLVGVLSWRWTSKTITEGMFSIVQGRGLMRQVHVPKMVFPTIVILTQTFKFLIVLVVLFVYLWVSGYGPNMAYWGLPFLFVVQLLFNAACTYLVAAVLPFVPDIKYLVISGMTLIFFISGIFFDGHTLDPEHQRWFFLNPAALLVDSVRGVLTEGRSLAWIPLATIASCSMIGIALIWLVVGRFDHRYVKIVR